MSDVEWVGLFALAAGVLLAFAFVTAGVVQMVARILKLQRRFVLLADRPIAAKIAETQARFEKLRADLATVPDLIRRMKAAAESIDASRKQLSGVVSGIFGRESRPTRPRR